MNKDNWHDYRSLKDYGWNVQKHNQIRFNSGSETPKHIVGKSLVGHIGLQRGYRVNSEVTHPERGEIDVLWYGHPEKLTYAIELETNPTRDTKMSKLNRYVGGPIDEMLLLNLDEMPTEITAAMTWLTEEI